MTLTATRLRGVKDCCIGMNVSEPLVATAAPALSMKERRQGSTAPTHVFEPACFDVLLSRFGIMFFDDPVPALENLQRAARKQEEFWLVAWRSPLGNPFITTPDHAVAPPLSGIPHL